MFKTVLLAVDVNDLEGAKRPAETAVRLAAADGADLHVMNVVPDFGMALVGSFFSPDHNAQIMKDAKAALEAWAKENLKDVANVTLQVDQGTVYEEVLKESETVKADVIVVGAHKSQLKDYLIGPNAARISRHAKQSVFVVR
ncbi:universal stress protein [Cognatishimia sp. 1_MG-2023]|uniref:universal stress protein n=1 Tax=Cognatishimia sp. 1_MG-2023 TaxID=3062642 RepID=UPI0026E3F5F7|nr:universal stress protein [Cognatishimia sp. 1_MG-2023]MDO6725838.1 universal stress protein [Cognatishimia sp. 1_MG-2023]